MTRHTPAVAALLALAMAIFVAEMGLRDPGPGMLVSIPTPPPLRFGALAPAQTMSDGQNVVAPASGPSEIIR